jgi:aminopeptidase N
MKKFTVVLIMLTSIFCFSQKPDHLNDLYKSEWKRFTDYVAKSKEKSNPDTTFDVRFYHLNLDVSIDTNAKYIKGNTICKFTSRVNNLSNINLSLTANLLVDSITGNATSFTVGNDNINIILDQSYQTGQSAEVQVWYQGVPLKTANYDGFVYSTHNNGEPIIATLSTPYLAHYWYPCKDGPDDKADSVYLDITVPDTIINGNEVIAVSNGMLENVTVNGDKKTFSWRHRYPIVTYYVMVAISNYSHFQQSFVGQGGEAFPLDYWVFKEHYTTSQAGMSEMPEAMQFFSNIYGIYPFWKEKYGMSELGRFGAIENQTNTIINSMGISWLGTSVHELSHMWFGDMITCHDWHHAWLNEGFATYSVALWKEHESGIGVYHDYMNAEGATMGGTLYLQNDLDTFNIFQPIVYNKGAWVLHMLRGVLGDTVFFDCLKTYATNTDFVYKNATTEDFRDLCETISGKDLHTFFDQWVYDQYYPKYYYNFVQDSTSKILTLHIKQAQDSINGWREVFEMPIQIKIKDVNGLDTLFTVMNNQKDQEYSFQMNGIVSHMPSSVLLDPDKWIIRQALYKYLMPVGTDEMTYNQTNITIYPNPASDKITLNLLNTFHKDSQVNIFDVAGMLVKSELLTQNQQPINVGDLSNGIYLVEIRSVGSVVKQKLVIQR